MHSPPAGRPPDDVGGVVSPLAEYVGSNLAIVINVSLGVIWIPAAIQTRNNQLRIPCLFAATGGKRRQRRQRRSRPPAVAGSGAVDHHAAGYLGKGKNVL